ncbi:hypothetical protein BGZ73_006880 [Actinomortierella ambigua]|nr:hypothetical protein BGZ73_006880 [Actinomortierella ambigua]
MVMLMDKDGMKVELEVDYQHDALTLRLAVPKSLQLKLDDQSSQAVPAFSMRTVTQEMKISNPSLQQPVRMRYHVSYQINGRQMDTQGEFNDFPIV